MKLVDALTSKEIELTTLKLNGNNRIEDTEVEYLSRLFSLSTSLKELELKETNLKEGGLLELISSIKFNRTVRSIDCTLCRITLNDVDQVQRVQEAFAHNTTLQRLDLVGNIIDAELDAFLQEQLEYNE
jgi:Ran GTPase-activating protein (RanGAP) involved in mRNA processing and transport